MADFEGKTALITGGARGMGRSHAVALAEAGADIAICDRCENSDVVGYPLATADDLAETVALVEKAGRRCLSAKVDVKDRAALESFVAEAEDTLGGIDIAITNAGISTIALLPEVESAQWDEVIGTNLTGTFNTIAAVAPGMIKRNYGRIVTVSSMLGHSANFAQASYVSSKWGVIGLTKCAAHDLVGYGITVNAVAPGNIETPMTHNDFVFGTMRPDLEKPMPECRWRWCARVAPRRFLPPSNGPVHTTSPWSPVARAPDCRVAPRLRMARSCYLPNGCAPSQSIPPPGLRLPNRVRSTPR